MQEDYLYWIFVDNKPIQGGLYNNLENAKNWADKKQYLNCHIEKYNMKNAKRGIIDMDDRSNILMEIITE